MRRVPGRFEQRGLLAVCVALAAVRFVLAARAPVLYEIADVWEPMSRQVAQGPLYSDPFPFYHFFPPWAWLLQGFRALAEATGLPFATVQRGFLAAVDVGTALTVAGLARRVPGALPPLAAAALYLGSPIAIWVSSVQGQFEGLSLWLLLLAVRASLPEPVSMARGLRAGLWLGGSIAAKQITALHPLLWLRGRAGIATVAVAGLVPAVTLLPYASEGWPMVRSLLMYGSVPRSYGLSELVLMDQRLALPVGLLALAAGVGAALWLRRSELACAALSLFLVILAFAPGMGSQYLLWPVALGCLFGGRQFLLYSGAATLWILGESLAWPGSGRWMGQLTWLTVVLWTIGRFREEIAARRAGAPA